MAHLEVKRRLLCCLWAGWEVVILVKAMILAAGEGTRLRPLTDNCPKPMVPLAGKPLLEYTLGHLRSQGVAQVAMNLHYKPEAVKSYFGDGRGWGLPITYSLEKTILGTAGALTPLAHYFKETFLLIYGDMLTDVAVAPLVEFHRSKGGLATIGVFQVADPSGCGIVDMDDDGRVRRFLEKPKPHEVFSHWANSGIYVLEPEVIRHIPPRTFYDFAFHLFPDLLRRELPLYACPIQGYIRDIGTWESYHQAEVDLESGKLKLASGPVPAGAKKASP